MSAPESPARVALRATLHCLTGCAVGEVVGMVLGTWRHWPNSTTVAVSIVLAFAFGYAFSVAPLRRAGLELGASLRLALAADTVSIAVMELVDNLIMLVIPGAMDAPLSSLLFWGALLVSLVLAGLAAWPVNGWLIARGRGHAVVHAHHPHKDHDRHGDGHGTSGVGSRHGASDGGGDGAAGKSGHQPR